MTKKAAVFLLLFLLFPALAAMAYAGDECYECHKDKTPGIVNYWQQSAHPAADVGCVECHGPDVELNHSGGARVEADKCGSCHEEAYASHRLGKHSIGLKTGRGCTRNMPAGRERERTCIQCHKSDTFEPIVQTECAMFLAQSPEMQRVGCGSCHRVETGCETCHTKHGTDIPLARSAETCAVCHMGPDHAQYEMWRGSPHGVIFEKQGEAAAPTCATCHMKDGSHNVSMGIATGMPADVRERERGVMVDICSECHTPALAKRSLRDADRIQSQSRALLAEAQGIVEELYREGLLEPGPSERPRHPIFGHGFVIGPNMLYEDISRAEAVFFRMMMFYYMSAFKGAFHQSPDYSHWFGNAPLKLSLSELKSEAALLRKAETLRKRLDNLVSAPGRGEAGEAVELKRLLRGLREDMLRGEMTEEEYNERKKKLLDERGL